MSATPSTGLRKKTSIEAYVDAYEKPNPDNGPSPIVEGVIVPSPVLVKPSVKALAFVSQKLAANVAITPSQKIANRVSQNQNQVLSANVAKVAKVSSPTTTATPSNNQKRNNWFSDDVTIQDAKFTEVGDVDDELYVTPSKPAFRKVPSRDTRELGLASKSVGPAGIGVISEQKRMVKSEFLKPSNKARNNRNNNRNGDNDWLIDEAFEHVVKAGKFAGKAAAVAIKEGFHGAKTGISAINELSLAEVI
jgi:hypothetical protein